MQVSAKLPSKIAQNVPWLQNRKLTFLNPFANI